MLFIGIRNSGLSAASVTRKVEKVKLHYGLKWPTRPELRLVSVT